jgi:hypothetical protein
MLAHEYLLTRGLSLRAPTLAKSRLGGKGNLPQGQEEAALHETAARLLVHKEYQERDTIRKTSEDASL